MAIAMASVIANVIGVVAAENNFIVMLRYLRGCNFLVDATF